MNMEKLPIIKSNASEHHYTEREKNDAIEGYENEVAKEIELMQKLKPQIDEQRIIWKETHDPKDFEALNKLEMDFKSATLRINALARAMNKKYDMVIDIPDIEAMFGKETIDIDEDSQHQEAA
tara:strand:- start:233 stop:601 length:369 start_codon:yes stop_codon:yes gene_type:complete